MRRIIGSILPKNAKNEVRRRIQYFLPTPYVMPDTVPTNMKFPGCEKGGLIITADFELAWAVRYSKRDVDPIQYANIERENVPLILKLADEYMIPITWATVGHLFLHSCSRGDHDWMSRIPYMDDHWRYTSGDWFDHDPYTNLLSNPEWYAPDLIAKIINAEVKHEISCHTFSHVDCSDKNCPAQVLDDEINACRVEADKLGIGFSSIAFPGGTAGNFAVLLKHGIKIYRRRIGKYEIAYPYRDPFGLLVSPTGPTISRSHRSWSIQEEFHYYKKAIDKAIRKNSLVHMWFHPSANIQTFSELMPLIMRHASNKRNSGDLWIGTMHDMQRHINGKGIL